jgi:hypothetical protein
MDQGVLENLKRNYRKYLLQYLTNRTAVALCWNLLKKLIIKRLSIGWLTLGTTLRTQLFKNLGLSS